MEDVDGKNVSSYKDNCNKMKEPELEEKVSGSFFDGISANVTKNSPDFHEI